MTALSDDQRWAAVLARNPDFDGVLFYAVASTGVYCRPSCAARRPRRDRVRFFASPDAAETAGYRACKRCKPDQIPREERQRAAVIAACRRLESAETLPDLAALAADAGLSPSHFHRLFKTLTGVTPKAYGQSHRNERARAGLRQEESVTEAIYGAGFNSAGRFYAASQAMLGMSPKQYREGGAGTEISYAVRSCWLGPVLVAATTRGVCAILFDDDPGALPETLRQRFPAADLRQGDAGLHDLVARVIAQVEQPGTDLDLPLDIRGTAFQVRVWQALRQIPAGRTASYAEIAQAIGAPRAVRAVAGACAANTLAVAIPCHRVIGKNGSLSGYRWGVARKAALLEREAKDD